MFADPQTVTISGAPYSFPRVGSDLRSGIFTNPSLEAILTVSHSVAKRQRHVVRFDRSKNAPDPLQPATNRPYSMSCYLVVDAPIFGYTVAELEPQVAGLTAWLTASSGANVTKLLSGES